MLLNDRQIGELCQGDNPMLDPFNPKQIRKLQSGGRALSHGLSSVGYDVIFQPEVKVLLPNSGEVDPKRHKPHQWRELMIWTGEAEDERYVLLPPHAFAIAPTLEFFRMPSDVSALAIGKSTNARSGLEVCSTVIDAGFNGEVVLEIKNQTSNSVRLYVGEGVAQIIFIQNEPPDIHYGQRESNYQGQRGVTHGTA